MEQQVYQEDPQLSSPHRVAHGKLMMRMQEEGVKFSVNFFYNIKQEQNKQEFFKDVENLGDEVGYEYTRC